MVTVKHVSGSVLGVTEGAGDGGRVLGRGVDDGTGVTVGAEDDEGSQLHRLHTHGYWAWSGLKTSPL